MHILQQLNLERDFDIQAHTKASHKMQGQMSNPCVLRQHGYKYVAVSRNMGCCSFVLFMSSLLVTPFWSLVVLYECMCASYRQIITSWGWSQHCQVTCNMKALCAWFSTALSQTMGFHSLTWNKKRKGKYSSKYTQTQLLFWHHLPFRRISGQLTTFISKSLAIK